MHQMVLFQELFQWVLPVLELMVMMLWHVGKLQDLPVNILLEKENHILLSL
jgi:hypothetical protein